MSIPVRVVNRERLFGFVPEDVAAFLPGEAGEFARQLVRLALDEDGPDLTSLGIFPPEEESRAFIVAKQDSLVAGLPLISLVLAEMGLEHPSSHWEILKPEASRVTAGTTVARIWGPTSVLLKAERVILNLITHLSGVANLTAVMWTSWRARASGCWIPARHFLGSAIWKSMP